MKYKILDSKINGKGCFANKNIKAGENITKFAGKKYTKAQMISRVGLGLERNLDDPFQIADDLFIDLKYKYLMFNHSCEPNAGIKGENQLCAISDILKGDEITFDYSTTVGKAENSWMMNRSCNCGSDICRKRIGSVLTISKPIIDKYLKAGVLQDFIRKQISN